MGLNFCSRGTRTRKGAWRRYAFYVSADGDRTRGARLRPPAHRDGAGRDPGGGLVALARQSAAPPSGDGDTPLRAEKTLKQGILSQNCLSRRDAGSEAADGVRVMIAAMNGRNEAQIALQRRRGPRPPNAADLSRVDISSAERASCDGADPTGRLRDPAEVKPSLPARLLDHRGFPAAPARRGGGGGGRTSRAVGEET